MNLVEFFQNLMAPIGAVAVILTIHKALGWSLLVSAAVGLIPGVILGYALSFLLLIIAGACVEGVRALIGRNKSS
jgi:hypothetical protein